MAVNDEETKEEFVYRISSAEEWEAMQISGSTYGGDLDRSSGYVHLSSLHQVKMTLKNFFEGRDDLFLLQIGSSKLGDGLIYEKVDEFNFFPHFYGPSKTYCALPLQAVIKAEKLSLVNGELSCSLLDHKSS